MREEFDENSEARLEAILKTRRTQGHSQRPVSGRIIHRLQGTTTPPWM